MLTPRSRILWGTGLENQLDFAWTIDSFVPTRKHRPGGQRVRIPGQGYDTWDTGKDFQMAGVARYVEGADGSDPIGVGSGWESPTGFEAFLTYAGDGGMFSFVPDAVSAPDFQVPNCWLEEPVDPDPTPEEDGTLAQALRIANATVPFGQALRGIMFEYAPGASLTDPVAATFTRASEATRIAKLLGLEPLATEAANVLRDRHYEGSLKTALLEASRQNLIENGDYETDAVGSGQNLATITRDATNVRRGSWALKVTTTNADNSGCFWNNRAGTKIAVTVGQPYTHSIWVYAPAASVGKIFRIILEWYTSAPAANGSSVSGNLTLVAGWQRLTWTGTPPASTATVVPTFYTNGAQGVFDVWVDMVQFEAGAFASSAISTGTGAVIRSGDYLGWAHPHRPQPVFFYYKGIWRSVPIDYTTLMNIGVFTAGVGQRIVMYGEAGGNFIFNHGDSSSIRPLPAYGDTFELLGYVDDQGRARIIRSINGGAEDAGSLSGTTEAFPASYTRPTFDLCNEGDNPVTKQVTATARAKYGPFMFGGKSIDTIAKARAA
jgi:hypothetical protein